MAAPLIALASNLARTGAAAKTATTGTQALTANLAKTGQASKGAVAGQQSLYGSYLNGAAKLAMVKSAFTGAADGITSKAVAAATALKSMADPINQLVGMSNPAPVEQFNIAFNDAIAVMGRGMLPITLAMTRAMRTLGDAYARVEPIVKRVSTAVGAGIDQVFGQLEKIWRNNGPALEMMGDVLVGVIQTLANVMSLAVKAMSQQLNGLSKIARLFGYKGPPDASAKGAANRTISTTTSGESISQRAIEKALAGKVNQSPEEKQVTLLDEMSGHMRDIKKFLEANFPNVPSIEALRKMLVEILPKFPGSETAGNALSDAVNLNPLGALVNGLRSAMTR
jgi:hypothetical protein